VLTARAFQGDGDDRTVELDEVPQLVADGSCLLWVDGADVSADELALLESWFSLHELEVEDVRERGQRAKVERYTDHAFLVAYARAADGDLSEVDFVFGAGWLVTVRERNEHGEVFEIEDVRARYDRTREVDRRVGFLLYTLLDSLVDGYFDAVEKAEDDLEDIEDVLFRQGPPPGGPLQQDLLDLRRNLVLFRRRVAPLRDVLQTILRRGVPWIEEDSLVYFEDVFDHLLRLLDQVDSQRELLGNVVEASLALGANRMNLVMKKMTSWGAILIVATLIAGIYGMNFHDMPELSWRFGYPAALGLMLVSTTTLYIYFKRKDWL
jgi:magnesium transporter